MGAIHQMTMLMHKAATSGTLDTASYTNGNVINPAANFQTDGTITPNLGTPSSPKWWSTTSPPATWLSYTSTGTGTIRGGLTASTRYEINTARELGINTAPATTLQSRTFTVTFYDAATGGNTLGTKTVTCTSDNQ